MTIVEFLEARLAEDEAAANAATIPARDGYGPHPELSEWQYAGDEVEYVSTPEMLAHKYPQTYYVTMDSEGLTPSVGEQVGPHIARHDPVRVLREVAAKRTIITEHCVGSDPCDAHDAWYESIPCDTVRALAAIYADHPDFDPTWIA